MAFQIMPIGNCAVRIDPANGETWVLDTTKQLLVWVKAMDPLADKPNLEIPPGTILPPMKGNQ